MHGGWIDHSTTKSDRKRSVIHVSLVFLWALFRSWLSGIPITWRTSSAAHPGNTGGCTAVGRVSRRREDGKRRQRRLTRHDLCSRLLTACVRLRTLDRLCSAQGSRPPVFGAGLPTSPKRPIEGLIRRRQEPIWRPAVILERGQETRAQPVRRPAHNLRPSDFAAGAIRYRIAVTQGDPSVPYAPCINSGRFAIPILRDWRKSGASSRRSGG
jgi:hypothetical protein